jgi:uncharacterized membrane protein YciS (DUF1049 family)
MMISKNFYESLEAVAFERGLTIDEVLLSGYLNINMSLMRLIRKDRRAKSRLRKRRKLNRKRKSARKSELKLISIPLLVKPLPFSNRAF